MFRSYALQLCEVRQHRGGAGAGPPGRVRGDREDDRRQTGLPKAGQIRLAEVAGPERPGAVPGGHVVAEEAGPDERLDVQIDDLARPVEVEDVGA